MASSPASVVAQMVAAGMPPLAPHELRVGSHRVVRYGPQKRAWYRVFESVGRTGRAFYTGAFGMWGRIEATRIEAELDERDRAELRARAAAAQAAEEAQRARRAQRAARSAQSVWREAHPVRQPVGYLARKQVKPLSVRVDDEGVIIVPMLRYDQPRERALVGVQQIWPDGRKHFPAGTAKAGSACRLGPRPVPGECLLLCEGLATGLSIAMAIGECRAVFVCFDAGNLVEVAAVLRGVYPRSPIGVCADDDYLTPDRARGGPGHRYAMVAARKAGGRADLLRPRFAARPNEAKWTDFNDLHVHEGLPAVAAQVLPFIDYLEHS